MSQGWPGTPVSGGQPSGGVFVAGPGAADEARRREEQAALDAARTGVTLEGGARAVREEVRGAAGDLRKAFEGQKVVTDYQTALPAYTSILNLAAQKPNKANDFTIITMFNKVQDPGSAVLEGERRSAQDVSTLYEKYKAQLQGLFDPETGFVSDDARRQFVQAVHGLIRERRRAYDGMRSRYADLAQQPEYGVRPELVVGKDFGEGFRGEIEQNWGKIFPTQETQAGAGGAEGPQVSVTPEQSEAEFGQVSYDENGNIVGKGYEGGIYDSTGQYLGLVGGVSADPVNVQDQNAPSFFGSVANAVTGEDRATQVTESLPDWTQMPEGSQIDWATLKTALGTAFGGSPMEIAQIVQSNFPGTVVWQDAKGNYILRSAMDGKDYAIKPGFQVSDIPRALNIAGVGALSGGRTIAGTAMREAGSQALIEGSQSATGGTFNPEDVLIAGGLGAAGKTIENAVPGALKMVRDIRGGGGPTPPAGGVPSGGGIAMDAAPELNPQAMVGLRAAPGQAPAADPLANARVFQPGDTAPGMRGGGSGQLDEAAIRAQRAQELPVPIELAKFQRSRNFVEQQRARELAKNNEVGAPIRARLADQQEALRQNFERFIDSTGAEIISNPRETGAVVDDALSKLARVAKTRVNVLYKRAEKAGETQEPITYKPLLDLINEQTPTTREKLAPILNAVSEQIAKNDPDKTGMIPINALEDVRKLINKNAQEGTPDANYGREMKNIIDSLTEGKGGELYQAARRARIEQAKLFENTAIIRDLMRKKPGTTDRAVALEDVTQRAILRGSVDDVTNLKKTLDLASSRGRRAWRELQGSTMEYLRDQAYKGVTRDESGQLVVSPAALNTAINSLDRAGKLDILFDKKTAELLRTANQVAQDLFSAPPGSVNASGTSSALLNAIDTLATYSVSGLPVPAGQVLNTFRKSLQERGLRKEVKRLLD